MSLVYNLSVMKRLYIPIFVMVLFLSQLGVITHDFHIHNPAENCDVCLSAHAFDSAITPSLQVFIVSPIFYRQVQSNSVSVDSNFLYIYSARAPPRFI